MKKKQTCRKCGYKWVSRIENPKQCPNCKQYITKFEMKEIETIEATVENISLVIPLELSDPLEKMAEDSKIPRNRLIVSAIRDMLEKQKYILK